jgi:DNA-binding CsgD family transcriptional regulator
MCVPGILFTGVIADLKDGRYFPFASAVGMIAAVTAVLLFNTPENFNAAMGCVYFFCSFMTMYSLAVFVRLADATQTPAFWAVAGRGIKYLAGGIFTLVGSAIFKYMDLLSHALIYVALLVALFIVFFSQGKLSPNEPLPIPAIPMLEDLIARYGLTNREKEVLRALIAGKSTSAIAEELFITSKTVQKYISSMISKANAESRAELLSIFTGQKV